ncbi:MAG: hypothetical protein K6T83_20220, partial [Alicyclobacillus sp.]|nr:hypothetical protein [Alicyclobacillus sp.]
SSTTPLELTRMALDSANEPADVVALAARAEHLELTDWRQFLQSMGVSWQRPPLIVQGHVLTGRFDGRSIRAHVAGDEIIGYGSFTQAGTHQALIEGPNILQIVSLDTPNGAVISTYRGPASAPIPNDVKVGAVDNSGKDVIFVNDVPAYILQANRNGSWQRLYTATSATFRFEGSVRFANESTRELITDDPSYMRNNPTRYFTSYTYRVVDGKGELVRNWRVYHTNVVNVTPIQFTPNGPTYIAADIYATGEVLVLLRHHWPVVPLTSGALACTIAYGYLLRGLSRRRRAARA